MKMAEISKKITYVTLAGDEQVHPDYESALKRVSEGFGDHHGLYIGGRRSDGKPEFTTY